TDTTVSEGTAYYYKVSATNDNGEGPLSGEASGTPLAAGTGASLTLNTWTNGNITTEGKADWYKITAESAGTYTIQWNDRKNSGKTAETLVSAYQSDGTLIFITWGSDDSPKSVDLSAGEIIYVRVAPQGNWALGDYAIQYYNPGPPQQAPSYVGTQGIPGPTCMVGFYWASVTGATGYKVYRSSSAGGTYDLVETVSGEETTSYTDTDVSVGTAYYYKVSATNAHGEGPLSGEASGTPPTPASLTLNTWATGNITTEGQLDWYQFTASTNATYYLQWDDSSDGTNAYSTDIMVVAFRSLEDILFQEDSGYSSPQSVSVSAGETIYVGVFVPYDYAFGTYAIRYYN
ncbi:MAG: fibronectin type III domain-containing protein, partial [Treponema sp.]|nr:fibronectin type III domain-containing protein [Treponema sp.]